MKSSWLTSWILIALLCALASGCESPVKNPLPQYQVQLDKLKPSPPAPTAKEPGARVTSGLVHDPIQISIKSAIGYQNLPTTITQLYDTPPRELSIPDVVTETLANNIFIKVQGYTLRIAEYEVPASKGIYDLLVGSTLRYDRVEQQTSPVGFGALGVNRSHSLTSQSSLSQLLPTGATIDLAYNFIHSSTLVQNFIVGVSPTGAPLFTPAPINVETYQHASTFGITQPLLRGFGPTVTNANIHIAQLEQKGAAADFQTRISDQLTNTLLAYWDLIGAVESFKVQVISYAAARDLLRINEAKFKAGVVPKTDVLQAIAAAESRRVQVILARQQVRDIEDRIKRLIFLQEGTPLWNTEIHPAQPIAWRETEVNLDETIQVAQRLRPELRRSQSNLDQTDVNLKVAKNNLLPQLNAFGQVQPNGLDSTSGRAFDSMSDGKFISYNAGIEFQYPLQNRTARYRYKEAQMNKLQHVELLEDQRNIITQEVRASVRDLVTARERITVTQSAVLSEEAKLAAEQKRYDVGISTAYQVIQFQQDLATAQSEHISAVVDYNKAAVRIERARGTLLDTYGVEVEGANMNPKIKPVLFPIGFN